MDSENGDTVLHFACKTGNEELVEKILHAEDVNAANDFGQTALQIAARRGNSKILQLLLNKGADVNSKNLRRETALHEAATAGDEECVKLLYEENPLAIAYKDSNGYTALHNAAINGHLKVVEYLLHKGSEIADFLLISGPLIDSRNNYGETPLALAIRRNQEDVVKFLLENKADIKKTDYKGNSYVHIAAMYSGPKILQSVLDAGGDVHSRNLCNETPLHVVGRTPGVIQVLVENGADINANTMDSENLLHSACRQGNEELVEMILKHDVNVNAADDFGQTALHLGARAGNSKILQLLLDKGAHVYSQSHFGETALHAAAISGDEECVKLLYEQDLCAIYAAKLGDEEHVLHKLNFFAIHDTDSYGFTALHNAAANGHLKIVEFLLSKGCKIDCTNYRTETPLSLAIQTKQEAMVKLLLENKADIQKRNYKGNSYVHIAAMHGEPTILQSLLDAGGDVHSRNFCNETPLHLAKSRDVVRVLIENGADINAGT